MGGRKGISAEEAQFNAEISRRVERLRKEKRVSHRELAAAAGVNVTTLATYEAGSARWPAFRLRLITEYFQVPVEQIISKNPHYVNTSCKTRQDR